MTTRLLLRAVTTILVIILSAGCGPKSIALKSSRYDGIDINSYMFTPESDGRYPAVILLHTIGGMKSHVTDFAKKLSEQGYVTLAVDYFSGRGSLEYDKTGYDQHIRDAYNWLKKHP